MAIAYLAHSSSCKDFVRNVAEKIGMDNCILDEYTFESGMKTWDEIERTLEITDVFVLFLSDKALESGWVKKELSTAHKLLKINTIKKIFPIIIDDNVKHDDPRIPEWMRNTYNLRYVASPIIAYNKINQRLTEVTWIQHPKTLEREQIFIGRNDISEAFQERVGSPNLQKPICVIAAGIPSIGRRSFLKEAFRRIGIMNKAYQPNLISLQSTDSIEDLIYKLKDLGYSKDVDLKNLLTTTVEYKVSIAVKLIKDIHVAKQKLLILDNACIVTHTRDIRDWFVKILSNLKDINQTIIGVASSVRPARHNTYPLTNLFTLEVSELTRPQRETLFTTYLELENIDLNRTDINDFLDFLSGYPEQIIFLVDMIKNEGLPYVKKNQDLIINFNSDKALILLQRYMSDLNALQLLSFLAKSELIDYYLINYVFGEDKSYENLLNEFLGYGICELYGSNKEYIRMNDIIRDYILRNKVDLPKKYEQKLEKFVLEIINNDKYEEENVSHFMIVMKKALSMGHKLDDRFLLPSHFLSTMIDKYNNKHYAEVISLADRALLNESNLDFLIVKDIRYYLCRSLARLGHDRFAVEVHKIDGADHDFLFGFYYRLKGKPLKAIEKQKKALKQRPDFQAAKRELVKNYVTIEEYEFALEMAGENYRRSKFNPFHIQAYAQCLMRTDKNKELGKAVELLLENLEKIKTDKSNNVTQMYLELKAEYLAFYENDEVGAMAIINSAINEDPNLPYHYVTKFHICNKFDNYEEMENAVMQLEKIVSKINYTYYTTVVILKAEMLAKTGRLPIAIQLIEDVFKDNDEQIKKLKQKLDKYNRNQFRKYHK